VRDLCTLHGSLVRSFLLTVLISVSRLLKLPLIPSRLDLLPRDRPNLTWLGGPTRDRAGNDINRSPDGSLLLVEVTDLVNLDFDDCHARVVGFSGVNTIAFVAEPCGDGRVVKFVEDFFILAAAVRESERSEDEGQVI